MTSIRTRLLVALIILVALISLLAAVVTYRRVLNETSTLFDYQLRQMALSLRSQISHQYAQRLAIPSYDDVGGRLQPQVYAAYQRQIVRIGDALGGDGG